MPIFDFKCTKCDKTFEELVASNTNATCTCGHTATKLIGGSAFVLNGKGWYNDGYGLSQES